MSSERKCPRCGAPGAGAVCAYCGARLLALDDDRSELAALDEFHRHVDAASKQPEQCSRLIHDGYIPSGTKALIEAGFRASERIRADMPYEDCGDQWAERIEAIASRLRVIDDPKAEAAAKELAAKAAQHRARSDHDAKMGVGCFLLCAAMAVGAVAYLFARLR